MEVIGYRLYIYTVCCQGQILLKPWLKPWSNKTSFSINFVSIWLFYYLLKAFLRNPVDYLSFQCTWRNTREEKWSVRRITGEKYEVPLKRYTMTFETWPLKKKPVYMNLLCNMFTFSLYFKNTYASWTFLLKFLGLTR